MTRCASAVACAAILAVAAGVLAAEEAKAPAKLNVLVLTGGHGFDKAKFPEAFAGQADIGVEIRQVREKGKPGLFDDVSKWPYDVLALYNFNQKLSPAEQESFVKLLDRGVGLVVLHHAIAAYPNWDEYEKIAGCKYFLQPMERDGVKYERSIWKHDEDIPVHVEDANHPITKGLKDFVVNDETYGKWTYHPGSHVLLTTNHPRNTKQLAWVKTYRKSRVFFCQLGHGPGAFGNANFQRLVAQGIRWTAGRLDAPQKAGAKASGT